MPAITPFLWFDKEAEEAVRFYTSIFPNSHIQQINYYSLEAAKASGMKEGMVMSIGFELDGQGFSAINGGPVFKFNEAISLVVHCKDQGQVDYYWEKLSANPEAEQCGWCKDKFGVSWQIVPDILDELINNPDKQKASRVMKVMLEMKKIDIAKLEKAVEDN